MQVVLLCQNAPAARSRLGEALPGLGSSGRMGHRGASVLGSGGANPWDRPWGGAGGSQVLVTVGLPTERHQTRTHRLRGRGPVWQAEGQGQRDKSQQAGRREANLLSVGGPTSAAPCHCLPNKTLILKSLTEGLFLGQTQTKPVALPGPRAPGRLLLRWHAGLHVRSR